MYATCLFCHSALGANESIEHFPVGKRLAFDATKGRLWVVCGKCERWNLSPLEERWEAIEEAERAYRDTKKRVATDNVGLARLNDGTDLIRIGAPLRPEFAAWRYGAVFGRRRRRAITQFAAVGFVGGFINHYGMSVAGLAVGGVAMQLGVQLGLSLLQARRVKVSIKDDEGRVRKLARGEAWSARYALNPDTGVLGVDVTSRQGAEFTSAAEQSYQRLRSLSTFAYDKRYVIRVTGDNAMRALSNIMPSVNMAGGSEKDVLQATALIEASNSPDRLFRQLANGSHTRRFQFGEASMISKVTPDIRLALEMSLHEEDERRAMNGELRVLEQRWKDAEEVANIADGLTLPEGISDSIDALRKKSASVSHQQVADSSD